MEGGQSVAALPRCSDVDLLGDRERVPVPLSYAASPPPFFLSSSLTRARAAVSAWVV